MSVFVEKLLLCSDLILYGTVNVTALLLLLEKLLVLLGNKLLLVLLGNKLLLVLLGNKLLLVLLGNKLVLLGIELPRLYLLLCAETVLLRFSIISGQNLLQLI